MLWVPERESYRSQIPKFLTFKGFFSWIYSERRCKSEQENCNARALKSAIPFRLPLEGCKGHQSDTYNVDTDNFAIGLLDLFQFPEDRVNMTSRSAFNTRPTLGNTRSGTLQRPRQAQRCACGRFWESGPTRWVNGGRRLEILEDPFCKEKNENE